MIKADKFLISRPLYAVDLASWKVGEISAGTRGPYAHTTMRAVWFRRRRGVTIACTGLLWDVQSPVPQSAAQFLAQHDDGRYGGDCHARWDGTGLWSNDERPEDTEAHLALLRPMLENYPAIPAGFDGWYRF